MESWLGMLTAGLWLLSVIFVCASQIMIGILVRDLVHLSVQLISTSKQISERLDGLTTTSSKPD
ncbi:MAG: hypothetical protein V7668_10530 [Cereibacter changlensis]